MRGKSDWGDWGWRILFVLVLSCLFVQGDVYANPAKSGEDCVACHTAVLRDLDGKRYVHRPEREGDCKYCHVAVQEGKGKASEAYLDKVKWVASGSNPVKEHWLEFEDGKRGALLLVEARSGGRLKLQEFPLLAFDELEALPTSSLLPPTISNVRLLEVTKGVFVSATIAWETDRPADSQVFYGFDKLDQSSMLDRQVVTNHVVMLTGVQPGKTYKYKAVSVDLAGNRGESATKSVLVEVVGAEKQGPPVDQLDGTEPELKVRCYRRGEKCLVVVSSDRPVSVRLGIMPKMYAKDNSGEESMVIRHLLLNTPAVTNIGICYACHVEYKKILSHPINVYPKRGMIIPPEYPTLPDGRMTCMSCHASHASNIEFRLIKDRKEELCRGCHQGMQ